MSGFDRAQPRFSYIFARVGIRLRCPSGNFGAFSFGCTIERGQPTKPLLFNIEIERHSRMVIIECQAWDDGYVRSFLLEQGS